MESKVARVAVDMPLANLDRPFDYSIPAELSDKVRVGVRVKVRFAGRQRNGFVVQLSDTASRDSLSPLTAVISAEQVLVPEVAGLIRDVADHYLGSFSDVVRAAVPPRHATVEKAETSDRPLPRGDAELCPALSGYPDAAGFLAAIRTGGHPRAAWTVAPSQELAGNWLHGFTEAAAAALASRRGVILLVPDATALDKAKAHLGAAFGSGSFVALSNDAGPATRYRSFLAISRGHASLVVGTRAAVFAPVPQLGLIAMWDDGNDAYAEPHAPYWHTREVAALRAHRQRCALLFAAHGRTAEVQQLVERGWLGSISAPPQQLRPLVAAIRSTAPVSDRDPFAEVSRIPKDTFTIIRNGLTSGPVLVQVPRSGYRPVLVCAQCRERAECPRCGQALSDTGSGQMSCRWCGPTPRPWHCPSCGSTHLRSAVVGVARTAEELGRAFPGVPVWQSSADKRLSEVTDAPALVFATPGAEPTALGGYAAAVLLDTERMLARADLRTGEESLRRWLSVTALVRPAEQGGTISVVGPAGQREIQALLRLDPVGYARQELAQRGEAGFPPAVKLVTIQGPAAEVSALRQALRLPDAAQVIGPFPLPPSGTDEAQSRLTVRCPHSASPDVLAILRENKSTRAARKLPALRFSVDPQVMD